MPQAWGKRRASGDTMEDAFTYLAQGVVGAIYAAVLELGLKRRYEPGYTWVTVVGGTALVGLIIAARLAWAPLPVLQPVALAWWLWWLWTFSFAAAGLPIVVWQVVLQDRRWRQIEAAWEKWNNR